MKRRAATHRHHRLSARRRHIDLIYATIMLMLLTLFATTLAIHGFITGNYVLGPAALGSALAGFIGSMGLLVKSIKVTLR